MTSLAVHSADFHVWFKTHVRKNGAQMKLKISLRGMNSLIALFNEFAEREMARDNPFSVSHQKHHGHIKHEIQIISEAAVHTN